MQQPSQPELPLGLGVKYDLGKLEFSLLPPHALDEVVKVLNFGSKKYARNNWRKLQDAERRYFDAALRHIWALAKDEPIDPESGLSHEAHAICCLLFILQLKLENPHYPLSINKNPYETKS
jgi:hypothetical protein